jgi:hypothetical protein
MKLLFEQSNGHHIWITRQNIQFSIGPPCYILGLVKASSNPPCSRCAVPPLFAYFSNTRECEIHFGK